MYLIGFDVGSSSVKAALVHVENKEVIALSKSPTVEMQILSKKQDWAEQDPELWWKHLCKATKTLLAKAKIDPGLIKGIGIAYQMHGLVLVNKDQKVLRSAIIWCDSRAVKIGSKAFDELGQEHCLERYLNSPGNFTASKLKWVKENKPELYGQIHKIMLPGDYISMKMSGQIRTTITGLSEGIFWDFKKHQVAIDLIKHFGFEQDLLPNEYPSIAPHGSLSAWAANELGLAEATPITYKAGDQPNNAMSLGVNEVGQVAASGGTSGVIYAIMDEAKWDPHSRVNGFAHVNHDENNNRIGILLCINGAGIQYAWLKKQMEENGLSYDEIERAIQKIPIGSDGLLVMPFGNGAERMLGNKNVGAQILNLHFNLHDKFHLFRAALEGIAFSFYFGIKILQEMGLEISILKVANDNLFQSKVFSTTLASLINCPIEMIDATGAVGAALASGIEIGLYENLQEAFSNNKIEKTIFPSEQAEYLESYLDWEKALNLLLDK